MHSSGESGEAKRTSDFLVWGFSFRRAFYRSEGLTDIVFFVACYIVSQSYPVLFLNGECDSLTGVCLGQFSCSLSLVRVGVGELRCYLGV